MPPYEVGELNVDGENERACAAPVVYGLAKTCEVDNALARWPSSDIPFLLAMRGAGPEGARPAGRRMLADCGSRRGRMFAAVVVAFDADAVLVDDPDVCECMETVLVLDAVDTVLFRTPPGISDDLAVRNG